MEVSEHRSVTVLSIPTEFETDPRLSYQQQGIKLLVMHLVNQQILK